jgi:hypothetical protein
MITWWKRQKWWGKWQIIGMDGEGMVSDNDWTEAEASAECFWYEGELSLDFSFLLWLGTGFLYYAMSTLRVCSLVYLQREWKDGHKKIRKRGIRGSENKGNEDNRYLLGTHAGLSLLSQADPSCITSFMLVFSSWMPIWSQSCHSTCLLLFCLHGSRLGLFFFKLPPFPPASPTRSVSIQILITDCGNSAIR